MKKFLLALTVAFAFMACDPVDLPKKDSKALDAVTYEALAQLGKDRADFEKTLTSLGFIPVEVEYTSVPDPSPCKFANAPASRKDVLPWDYSGQQYVYGIKLTDSHIKDDDLAQMIQSAVEKGNTCITLNAEFINAQLFYTSASFYLPITPKVNYAYAGVSDEMYKQLEKKESVRWNGSAMVAKELSTFTDHAKYSSFIGTAQAIQAEETGDCMDFSYYLMWNYPDEETQAAMLEEGFKSPFIYGWCVISSGSAIND